MSNVLSLCSATGDFSKVEDCKAEIIARLRAWVDELERDESENPLRVVFVVEYRNGHVAAPQAVGARTTAVHAVGMLHWASNRQMNSE